jgi:hypothetical protein
MNRREFVRFSAAVASLSTAASPLFAAEASGDLLRSPGAWVGQHFVLDDGTTLTLTGVESLTRNPRVAQSMLRFSTDAPLADGTYLLRSANAGHVSLFLQSGDDGAQVRAHISRLV